MICVAAGGGASDEGRERQVVAPAMKAASGH
jgi:hypothetical protein